jgi:trehalose 6-phosphate synthase/phosphatase
MNDFIKAELIEKYRNADSRLVLLDYDGTLVDYTPIPVAARLTDHLFDILIKLHDTPQTEIFIITGRGHQETEKIFANLPINIIAEHGAMIRERGIWENQINNNCSWKETVIPILNQITTECPESFIEEKDFSLAWHYRNAESQSGFAHSRKLINTLEARIHSYDIKILDGNKVVEVMTKEVGKGKAVKKLCEQSNYDFILSIGDDATDEDMFEFFLHITRAYTIKVGNGKTFAKYKFASINDVVFLLKQLSL